jgi:hypothetical protein
MDSTLVSAKFSVDATDELHQWAAQRSFDLFLVSRDNRMQRHWEPVSMGWLYNFNYRVRLFSEIYLEQWRAAENQAVLNDLARRQAIEAAQQAARQDAAQWEAARQEEARQAAKK